MGVSILPCQIKSPESFALSLPFGVLHCKTHPCAVGELGVSELIGMSVSPQPTRALGFFAGDWVQGPLQLLILRDAATAPLLHAVQHPRPAPVLAGWTHKAGAL